MTRIEHAHGFGRHERSGKLGRRRPATIRPLTHELYVKAPTDLALVRPTAWRSSRRTGARRNVGHDRSGHFPPRWRRFPTGFLWMLTFPANRATLGTAGGSAWSFNLTSEPRHGKANRQANTTTEPNVPAASPAARPGDIAPARRLSRSGQATPTRRTTRKAVRQRPPALRLQPGWRNTRAI